MNLFRRWSAPSFNITINIGQEHHTMPVSKDVQDFCAGLGPAVQTYTQAQVDAAVAAATAGQQAAIDKAVADATAGQQAAIDKAVADATERFAQDHADEIQAMQAALAAATTPPAPAG